MKKFLKIIGGIILIPYLLIAICVTICLLGYNKYGITKLGDYTLIPVTDEALAPNYHKGELVVVEKKTNDDIKSNDNVFFYNQDLDTKTVSISLGKVINTRKISDVETTFTMEGDVQFSSEYVIGSTGHATVYKDIGGILNLLESRWVFLLFIILPILFIFIYEIYEFVLEIKKGLKDEKEVVVEE